MKQIIKQNLKILTVATVFILLLFIAFFVFLPQTGGKLRPVLQSQENKSKLVCNFTDDNIYCASGKCMHEINYIVKNVGKANLKQVAIRVIADTQTKKFNLKNILSGEKIKGQVIIETNSSTDYLFYDLSTLNTNIENCDGFINRTICPNTCLEKGKCYSGTCSKQTNYVCSYKPKENCCGNNICELEENFTTCKTDCKAPVCNDCESLTNGLCVEDLIKCPKKKSRKLTDYELKLVDIANKIGLNIEQFKSCMQMDEKKEIVEQQIYEGFENYWINHTPTFVLAGNVKVVGSKSTQQMTKIINDILSGNINVTKFNATNDYMVMNQPKILSKNQIHIQEFFDFKCPYSKEVVSTIDEIKLNMGKKVNFVYKNFPLDTECNQFIENQKHPGACSAAYAGECARDQGKFKDFYDKMFEIQSNEVFFVIE